MHVEARLGRAASQEVVAHAVCCVTKDAHSRVAQKYSRGRVCAWCVPLHNETVEHINEKITCAEGA